MASMSRKAFKRAQSKALRLLAIATDRRLRPIVYDDAEPALHASLAASVSSWEAYIESITLEAIDAITMGGSPEVLVLCGLIKAEAKRAIDKFNTPNAENCRDLLLKYTGFDAFPFMHSPRLQMPANLARVRLNEILRVRHAFAHGFPIPAYAWTTRYGMQNRLTKSTVVGVSKLIGDMVDNVDGALSVHLNGSFPLRTLW